MAHTTRSRERASRVASNAAAKIVAMLVDKATFDLMTDVSTLVGGMGDVAERSRHDLEVLALFDRCRSLHGAIRLLLANDFVHETVILGRPLFADSLTLAEFSTLDDTGRAELAVRRERAGLDDLEGLYREARSRGDDVTTEIAAVKRRRANLDRYAHNLGLGRTRAWRADDHVKVLASRHGRVGEYIAHLVTQPFVHGSTMATSQRYSVADETTVQIGGVLRNLRSGRAMLDDSRPTPRCMLPARSVGSSIGTSRRRSSF